MKIALIAPPYPLEEAPSPPLGLSIIAAICEQCDAEVLVIDYIVTMYSSEKLKKQLKDFEPDIIGTNSVTMNFNKAAEILSEAKKIMPNALTLMGGPHVSFDAENTLMKFPGIDIIVMGEGEEVISQLISSIKKNESWKDLQGIAFRNNNEILINEKGPFIANLDSLPIPARHLLPLSKYRALGFPISITTSRGCPNMCIFCLGRKMVGFKVRYRKISTILDEIESLVDLGFTVINVADDIFTVKKERVIEFCQGIKERKINFSWSVFSRVNTIDEEMIEIMKDAGCTALSFGIESGNKEMLKRVKKGITTEQVYRADKICKDKGFRAHGSFIAGLPGETIESFQDSLKMQKDLNMEFGCHILAPFPGTTVREEIENYDLMVHSDDWDLYDANRAIISTSSLKSEDIMKLVDESHKDILDEWEDVKIRFETGETSDDETLRVLARFRTKLIYSILSEDLIENHGLHEGSHTSALSRLITFLAKHTDVEETYVKIFISKLIEEDLIQYREFDNTTEFFWKDFNSSVA